MSLDSASRSLEEMYSPEGSPRHQILHHLFVFCSSMTSLQLCMTFLIAEILASISCSSSSTLVFVLWVSHHHIVTEASCGETLDLFFCHPRQSYWVSLTFNYVVEGFLVGFLLIWRYLHMPALSPDMNCVFFCIKLGL